MDLTVAPTLTPAFFGPSGIFVGRCSRSRTQLRGTSTSKTPDSIQVDHLFRKVETSVYDLFVNQIQILLFEYEYEKNQWYELPATMMPDGPLFLGLDPPTKPYPSPIQAQQHWTRLWNSFFPTNLPIR
jgi:hypothetical protein